MSYDAAKPYHENQLAEWTDERVADLKRLHAMGFSASQIARHLGGTTRNAVIGKINRLGLLRYRCVNASPLHLKSRVDGRTTRKTRKSAIRLKPKSIIKALPETATSAEALNISLLDLKPGMCRWPVGEDGAHLFCGLQWHGEHGPYCKDHHILGHMPYAGKRKRIRPPMDLSVVDVRRAA